MLRRTIPLVAVLSLGGCLQCQVPSVYHYHYGNAVADAARRFHNERGRWPDSVDELRGSIVPEGPVKADAIESADIRRRADGGVFIRIHVVVERERNCAFDDTIGLPPTTQRTINPRPAHLIADPVRRYGFFVQSRHYGTKRDMN